MNWVCVAPVQQVLAQAGMATSWLSEAEQIRCESFSTPARRQQFIAGRWLVRRLLAQATGAQATDLRLGVDAVGRCLLSQPWQASISHSGAWVGTALARSPVGLDVQEMSAHRDWRSLADFAGLQSCPDADFFYRHWTLAEAWLKAQPVSVDLAALLRLRWLVAEAGPGWHGQAGGLHWAVICAVPPQWLGDLVPGALQPPDGPGWAPLNAT